MQISEITAFLENAYTILNDEYFGGILPNVVITIQSTPKCFGHYTVNPVWSENSNHYHEINLGAETLDRPIEQVIATLLHEMTHHYCAVVGIKDTSRSGTYHNKNFKVEAEKRGLIIGYDSRIGHSPTTPSDSLIEFIELQGWQGVSLARQGANSVSGGGGVSGTTGKKSNVRKYICPECGCSVRATKTVFIGCLVCNQPMELVIN